MWQCLCACTLVCMGNYPWVRLSIQCSTGNWGNLKGDWNLTFLPFFFFWKILWLKCWKALLMETLLLFQIYRVWDLKASQITMKQNNDVLGLFFTWYIQVLIGFWVRQQFSLPESPAGPWRFAGCCQSRNASLWRSWTAVAGEKTKGREGKKAKKERKDFFIGPNQVQASHKKHFCSEIYYDFDTACTLLMVCVSKKLFRNLKSLFIWSSSLLSLSVLITHKCFNTLHLVLSMLVFFPPVF